MPAGVCVCDAGCPKTPPPSPHHKKKTTSMLFINQLSAAAPPPQSQFATANNEPPPTLPTSPSHQICSSARRTLSASRHGICQCGTPFVDNFQSSCLNPDLGRLFWLEVRTMPPLLLAGGSSFCIEDLLFATAILCHPVAVFRWLFLEALRSSPRLIFSKFTPAQTLFRAEGTWNQLTASASTLERDDEAM